jgi:predicted Zn finger-like uncharacterized protein
MQRARTAKRARISKGSVAMPIRAHCPSCRTEYTLVDSLRGKYVRCEHCHQSFQANPTKQELSGESTAPTNLPPLQLTPPESGGLPRTILNAGNHPVKDVPRIARPARQVNRGSSGAGRAGFPIGIVILVVFGLRACISLSNSSSLKEDRSEPPRHQVPKIPQEFDFRFEKEKGILVIPKEKKVGQ